MAVRKTFKIFLLLLMLLLPSCKSYHYYASSIIKGKLISSTTYYKQYYFIFRENKEYKKRISLDDFNKYDLGNKYTFEISEKEQEYFYKEHIEKKYV